MKSTIKLSAFLLLIGVLFYFSCKKEYSCEGCRGGNKPPIANAGLDQTITLPTDSVSLDGNASSDPDGTISSFLWTKISGPASFNIRNTSSVATVVKNLAAGVYRFELKITDNGGLSAKDTMQVIVDSVVTTNHPPVANAGADQTITLPTNTVNLDGSGSTDPDNNITGYTWTKISGPSSFSIANTGAVQTQVTNLIQGTYQFELKVIDWGGLFSKDTMQISVISGPPPPPPPSDTLSGQEFIFNELWTIDFDGAGLIYTGVENRPDLFSDPNRSVNVSIRLDTTNAWITVQKMWAPGNSNGYVYGIYSNCLFIYPWPYIWPPSPIVGTMVSIKVKFL